MRINSFRKQLEHYLDKNIARILRESAILLEKDIKQSMRGKGPPAAPPGETPHVRTGTLRRSVTHDISTKEALARVGTTLKYGKYLELGTKKMKARPFIRPAMERCAGQIKAKFRFKEEVL